MLIENGELILKTKKFRILLMIILDPLSATLAGITGMIIPCHRQKVLVALIISSNGIKITPASRTSKQNLTVFAVSLFSQFFMDEVKTVIRDMKNNKSLGSDIPIQILK